MATTPDVAASDVTENTEGQTSIVVPEAAPEGQPQPADTTVDAPFMIMDKNIETSNGFDFGESQPQGGEEIIDLVAELAEHFENEGRGLWDAHLDSLTRSHVLFMDIREKVEEIRKAYQIPANVMPHKVLLAVLNTEDDTDKLARAGFVDGYGKASDLAAITNHSTPERFAMYVESTKPCKDAAGLKQKRRNPTIASYGAWLKAYTGNVRIAPGCTYPPHIDATTHRRVDPKPVPKDAPIDMLEIENHVRELHIMAVGLDDDIAAVFGEVTDEALVRASEWLTLYLKLREVKERVRLIDANGPIVHIGDPNAPVTA